MIQIGDALPAVTLYEYNEVEREGCALGPAPVQLPAETQGKTVVIFALPGAFTPTCSAKHLPGYLAQLEALRARGVDEVWCLAVNDAFVMQAWGRETGANGRIRMLADGSADFARAVGLTLDLGARGMGLRSQRYAMVVRDGRVVQLHVEAAGEFRVSAAEHVLGQLG